MIFRDEQCPKCGGSVISEGVCPGHPVKGRLVHCIPPCGEAQLWECNVIISCGWWFIDGMHPKNKLFDSNEERRPSWLMM